MMLMMMMMFLPFDSFIFRDMKNRSHWGGGHFLFDEARVYFVGQKSNKKAATPVRSLGQQSWNLFLEMYPEFKYE